ncbi:hypothetical protein DPEC_G00216330 [Dallia pectoralis]|uniref:Uncharacterized protein n=1 Tax=Dallia pectoralis TaxID=75939 RepID=A0ACC2G288_DALPE|nr:hypothetical protein DPEC_G00216330 [Dallia pectoralis]
MKLNPQQAPLYGDCLLTVQLGDEERLEDEGDVEFYLVFAGTTQRHLTSTSKTSHVTLQAVCPAHDRCESVQVTLCSARPGGSVDPVAKESFHFVQDLALDMAQFLVSAAGRAEGLEGALLLDECQIPLQECERLDESLSLALRHLALPQGWSILGSNGATPHHTSNQDNSIAEPGPQETLLHFAARRGLQKVALFLLQQPGGREALRLPNKQGFTPVSFAETRGHGRLQQLFSEVETSSETRIQVKERQHYTGARELQHHPRLNTYTLTVDTIAGKPPPSLKGAVEELQKLIQQYTDHEGDVEFQQRATDQLNIPPATSSDLSRPSAHPTHCHARLPGGARLFPNGQLEEGEAGPAQAAAEDCGKVPDKRSEAAARRGETLAFSTPSCGSQPQEADRESTGVITARQGGRAGRRKRNKAEREKRRAKKDAAALASPAMGQAQSHENPEDWQEPQRDGERTPHSGDTEGQGEPETEPREPVAGVHVEKISAGTRPEMSGYSEANDERFLRTTTAAENSREAHTTESQDPEQRQETAAAAMSYSEEHGLVYECSQTSGAEGGEDRGGAVKPETEAGNPWQPTDGSSPESVSSRSGDSEMTDTRPSPSTAEGESESGCVRGPDRVPSPEPGERVPDLSSEGTEDIVAPPQIRYNASDNASNRGVPDRDKQPPADSAERASEDRETTVCCDVTLAASLCEGETEVVQACEPSEECTVRGQESPGIKKMSIQWAPLDESDSLDEPDCLAHREEIAATAVAVVAIAIAAAVSNIEQCNSTLEESQVLETAGSQPLTRPRDKVPMVGVTVSGASLASTDESPTFTPMDLEDPTNGEAESNRRQSEGSVDQAGEKPEAGPGLTASQGDSRSDSLSPDERAADTLGNKVIVCPCFLTDRSTERTQLEVFPEIPVGPSDSAVTLCARTHPDGGCSLDTTSLSEHHSSSAEVDVKESLAVTFSDTLDMLDGGNERTMDTRDGPGGLRTPLDESPTDKDTDCPAHAEEAEEVKLLSDMVDRTLIHTEKETFYPVQPCSEPTIKSSIPECTECPEFPCSYSVGGSVCDVDSLSSAELGEDSVFRKGEEAGTGQRDSTGSASVSDSSIDDLASINPLSASPETSVAPLSICSQNSVAPLSICSQNSVGPLSISSQSTVGPEDVSSQTSVELEDVSSQSTVEPEDVTSQSTVEPEDVSSQTSVEPEDVSSQSSVGPISVSSQNSVEPEDVSSQTSVELEDVSSQSTVEPEDVSSQTSVEPEDVSSQSTVEPEDVSSQNSVGPISVSSQNSVEPEDVSSQRIVGPKASCSPGDTWQMPGPAGEEEEKKDKLAEVSVCPTVLRSTIRPLSPFRRHSWGPGKNPAGETDMNQRSSLPSQGEGKPPKPTFHRRSMSWCPSNISPTQLEPIDSRSYSLEGLAGDQGAETAPVGVGIGPRGTRLDSEERGSLLSLTEEQESELGDCLDNQKSGRALPLRHPEMPHQVLTKSVSMLAISNRDLDGMGSFTTSSGSLEHSISEEDPGPLRSDTEGRQGTKVSRTFSYLKSKMSTKKNKEKDKDKGQGKDKEPKEKERKTLNGHLFSSVSPAPSATCHQCNKPINSKETFLCTNCNAQVHKGCRESLPLCGKARIKQQKQQTVTDSASVSGVQLRTTALPSSRERPWSAVSSHDDTGMVTVVVPRRNASVRSFNGSNLSKSISISNIAGPLIDEMSLKMSPRYLSQSTDSLHKTSKVNESTESLTDEGTEMMDSQLMGEFEAESKDLEADSWTFTVDKKYVKGLKKEVVKRQDVIYELIQTEMHHVRTLKIMSEVYSKGLQKEVQLETQTVEKVFPMLDDLLETHTQFFANLLERKRTSSIEGRNDGSFLIRKIGDVLASQFSGLSADHMKRVYGKFCSRHNEAVNFYKELHTKDKRFQAFIKKKMSSTIVRRLGIPECILLVTQRITKYPVLLQRILQHTKENEEDHEDITNALRLVKEMLNAVDSKVNEHDKKKRLKEVYSRTDSKSIQRMKSGQMFAREDLVRGRKLLHDGPLQLKNSTGRLKDVQAMLLSDVFVFLQEKDQKYVFASLDQRSTVISLQKLIVREVANEERGLFLITAGIEKPEMVEVLASTKEERNTWMQLIQDALQSIEKDDDEGIPSESEEDKRLLETKAREMRELLRKKDEQIVCLLEEKVKVFRDMCEDGHGGSAEEPSAAQSVRTRMLFRATVHDVTKGEPIMKDALREVETLNVLVNGSLAAAMGQHVSQDASGAVVGPVCLPRRADTFGGFDSHQMNLSKHGEKEEGEDPLDLRRTESDGGLKKGGSNNLLYLLKKNSEVLHSVTHLHDLLNSLQAVVVQQDTFIEDQRSLLADRTASRHSSTSSLTSLSSRPNSLIEQEKQRSLEKQRQEVANLQRQQTAHAEERRRREREWEVRESGLSEREELAGEQEKMAAKERQLLEEERQELQRRKEEYQRDLERLRDAQRKLDRDKEALRREAEMVEQMKEAQIEDSHRPQRTSSTTSEDSAKFQSSSLDKDHAGGETELSTSPAAKEPFLRMRSKRKGKSLNNFWSSNNMEQAGMTEVQSQQLPIRLLQLAKTKKKKIGKALPSYPEPTEEPADGDIFFC